MASITSDRSPSAFERSAGPIDELPLPEGYSIRHWHPTLREPYPRGVPGAWLFALAGLAFSVTRRLRLYRVVLLSDPDGSLIHASVSLPNRRLFSFMGPADIEALSLSTNPASPVMDQAAAAGVCTLISELARFGADSHIWYAASKGDRRAVALAHATGFVPIALRHGRKASRIGRLIERRFAAYNAFDYATITEDWNTSANVEQREMSYLRHELVRREATTARLLDVACGTAYGFARISSESALAVGMDLAWENLETARAHLPNALLVQASADALPFREQSFDVVSCLEALYYFPHQRDCILDMGRVLRPGGRLVASMPNPLRPGFNASTGSTTYLTPRALAETLQACHFAPIILGAFRWDDDGPLGRFLEVLRVLAVKTNVMPGSLAARALLKRFAFRDMRPLADFDRPIDVDSAVTELAPPDCVGPFKVVAAVAVVHRA